MKSGSGARVQRFGGVDQTSDQPVVTRIDHLEGVITEHIQETLLPRAREHTRISVGTDKVDFLFFQKLHFGRHCSCWDKVNAGPDKQCPICFGQTFVGGFRKFGCEWEVLDVTAPAVTLVNVIPNYEAQKRPIFWTLLPTAVRGYIEWKLQLAANIGTLDLLKLAAFAPKGSKVLPFVRLDSESSFTEMSRASVEARLRDANGSPTVLVIRILLLRGSPKAKVPVVSHLHFRYRNRTDIKIPIDIPRDVQSITLAELGLYDSWQPIQLVLDNSIPNLSTEDFFIRVRDGIRWKVTEVNPLRPAGILIGTDAQARRVQAYENYSQIP